MTQPFALPRPVALVLTGGNSLGAFQAGAYQGLHRAGIHPDWIVGSSIGAVNGALIAGNPVEQRIEALRSFWSQASLATVGGWAHGSAASGDLRRLSGQVRAMLLGNPAIFAPNAFGFLAGGARALGIYNLEPLRSSLDRLVDFDRLNRGDVRFSVVATDLETGAEALFDTSRQRIGPDHILASAALIPDFCPIEIEGRLLADGGLVANLPLHVVQRAPGRGGLCVAVDLFNPVPHRPANLGEAALRREELFFSSHSRWLLEETEREDRLLDMLRTVLTLVPEERRALPAFQAAQAAASQPPLEIVRLTCGSGDDVGNYLYDYSDVAVATRWQAGEQAAADACRAREQIGQAGTAQTYER